MINSTCLKPIPSAGVFRQDGWHLWGGTALFHENRWYRIFARWKKEAGFNAWVTHSEIAGAVGDGSLGPWSEIRTLLGRSDASDWDHNFHNPFLVMFDGRFWLFYTGTRGNGEFWNHRNNQRIGVAVADHPLGPYERLPAPVIDVSSGGWDHLITACPIVSRGPDGLFRMIYKGVSDGPAPFGGTVRMGLAIAEHPSGPWKKQKGNFFCKDGVQFTTDDNYFWYQDGSYWAIVKDYGGHYQDQEKKALVVFSSPDAIHWEPVSPDPVLSTFSLMFDDGKRRPFFRVEQPQLVFDSSGRSIALCLSIKEKPDKEDEDLSYTVMVPLGDC